MNRAFLMPWAVTAGLLLAVPAAANERLNGDQIRALYVDAVIEATTSRGGDFVGHYMADGTMKGDVNDGKYQDEGTWEVADGMLCRQWSQWGGGGRKCFVIEHVAGNEYRSIDAGGTGTTTFRKR